MITDAEFDVRVTALVGAWCRAEGWRYLKHRALGRERVEAYVYWPCGHGSAQWVDVPRKAWREAEQGKEQP